MVSRVYTKSYKGSGGGHDKGYEVYKGTVDVYAETNIVWML